MNKTELNSVFELMNPSNNQKDKMFHHIIQTEETIKTKKQTVLNRILKVAASFVLIFCITGSVAYGTGLLDKILGYFSIESNFVSWATSDDLLKNSSHIDRDHSATQPSYDEIYTYDAIEEALQKHKLNIAIPKSKLLSYDPNEVSIKISTAHPNITITNFYASNDLSAGTVEISVNCYEYNNLDMDISTSQYADKASTYISKSGTQFTLLEADVDDKFQTVANIMINADNNHSYYYSFIFTNVPKTDIEDTLDSIDMSIYVSN